MMTGYLLTADGRRVELPPFSAWELRRTGGVPCDSFEGSCPWEGGVEPLLAQASRVILEEEGARRFTGVLDEYEISWGEKGGRLTLSGRGLAALLLDGSLLQPVAAALLGLIPNCAASVLLTRLYLAGAVSFGALAAGLLSASGVGVLVLFRANPRPRENLAVLGLVWGTGGAVGLILQLLG